MCGMGVFFCTSYPLSLFSDMQIPSLKHKILSNNLLRRIQKRCLQIPLIVMGLISGHFSDSSAQETEGDSSTAIHPLEGNWLGLMKIGKFEMELKLNLESKADGTLKSTMDFVNQGRKGVPIQAILYK